MERDDLLKYYLDAGERVRKQIIVLLTATCFALSLFGTRVSARSVAAPLDTLLLTKLLLEDRKLGKTPVLKKGARDDAERALRATSFPWVNGLSSLTIGERVTLGIEELKGRATAGKTLTIPFVGIQIPAGNTILFAALILVVPSMMLDAYLRREKRLLQEISEFPDASLLEEARRANPTEHRSPLGEVLVRVGTLGLFMPALACGGLAFPYTSDATLREGAIALVRFSPMAILFFLAIFQIDAFFGILKLQNSPPKAGSAV